MEHFHGRTHTIHISNSDAEDMLRAWSACAERLPSSTDLDEITGFLRQRLTSAYGCRQFSLCPPPPELAVARRLRCLASIIAAFSDDLAAGRPDPDPDVDIVWDRELELRWLAKQWDLYDFVRAALPPDEKPLSPLRPKLADSDLVRCRLNRLENRAVDMDKRNASRDERLQLIERRIELARDLPEQEVDEALRFLFDAKCNLLLDVGRCQDAAAALRESLARTGDHKSEAYRLGFNLLDELENGEGRT